VQGGASLENEERIKIANEISLKNERENLEMNNRVTR
jgi:hypothetical protein